MKIVIKNTKADLLALCTQMERARAAKAKAATIAALRLTITIRKA
mgnify:CR=1 FL=1